MCNAQAKPKNPRDANIAGTTWTEDKSDQRKGFPTVTATGRGSDVDVPFNPWLFNGKSCGTDIPTNRADCVLVHELMHCLASLSGKFAFYHAAPRAFDNLEEFTAIVITNIYLSETGAQRLVGGHHGEILPAELVPGKAFYDAYKEPLQQVCKNHQGLVRTLRAGVNIAHNPFLYCAI
jgi:hypothetical protein